MCYLCRIVVWSLEDFDPEFSSGRSQSLYNPRDESHDIALLHCAAGMALESGFLFHSAGEFFSHFWLNKIFNISGITNWIFV